MATTHSPALIKPQRDVLPQYYQEAVSMLENIAYPVLEPCKNPHETDIALFTIAKYSLSGPCMESVTDLSELDTLRQTIMHHSPEARFRDMLGDIKRRRLFGTLVERARETYGTKQNSLAAGAAVADLLATEFPNCKAVMDTPILEAAAQRLAAVAQAFLEKHGQIEVHVRNVDKQPNPSLEEAEIEVSPGDGTLPQDRCLSWPRRPGGSADLEGVMRLTTESFVAFVHLIPLGDDDADVRCSLLCYLVPGSDASIRPAQYLSQHHDPFSITLPLKTFISLINANAVAERVVVKIDERFREAYPNLMLALGSCRVQIFVLAHRNTPANFEMLARSEYRRVGLVHMAFFGIRGADARFTILLAMGGNSTDRVKICSAMSEHGVDQLFDLVKADDTFRYYDADSQNAFFKALGMTQDFVAAFNLTTYADLPRSRRTNW